MYTCARATAVPTSLSIVYLPIQYLSLHWSRYLLYNCHNCILLRRLLLCIQYLIYCNNYVEAARYVHKSLFPPHNQNFNFIYCSPSICFMSIYILTISRYTNRLSFYWFSVCIGTYISPFPRNKYPLCTQL